MGFQIFGTKHLGGGRRKSNVTDLEAFRRGAASVGGYHRERAEHLGPYTHFGFDDHSPASSVVGEHRAPLSAVPRGVDGGAHSKSSAIADGRGAEGSDCADQPTKGAEVPAGPELRALSSAGHPTSLYDKRRQERQQVWARRDAQSIAQACAQIDELHAQVAKWERAYAQLEAAHNQLKTQLAEK